MPLVFMGSPCLGGLGPKGKASFKGRGRGLGICRGCLACLLGEDGIPCLLFMKRLS